MSAGNWLWRKVADTLPPQRFEFNLPHRRPQGGYTPQRIRLEGVIYANTRQFEINLKNSHSGETFFYFDPLYNQKYALRKGGGREQQGDLPYKGGKPFALDITADGPTISVKVQMRDENVYDFVANDPLKHVTSFEIIGDLNVHLAKREVPLLVVPYERPIQGLSPPERIKIIGVPFSGALREFTVKLMDVANESLLIVNPKFNQNVVERNSTKGKKLQAAETDGGFPFAFDKIFTLEIMAVEKHVEIYVDNNKLCNFVPRDDLTKVTNLVVTGDINLTSLTMFPEEKLSVPFETALKGFSAPQRVRVIGTPKEGRTDYFQIRLETDDGDVYLDVYPRFSKNTLCRDTYTPYKTEDGIVYKRWQREEDSGSFPFEIGKQFMLDLVAKEKRVEIFVDGRKHSDFEARDDLTKITKLIIPDDGRLTLNTVEVGEAGTGSGKEKDANAVEGKADEALEQE